MADEEKFNRFLKAYEMRITQLSFNKTNDKVPFLKMSTNKDFFYDKDKFHIRERTGSDDNY